jgi:pectin methylesterase-like acyl-CoA thioesterase
MVLYSAPQGNAVVSKYLVSNTAGSGYYTTIQAAINAANATTPSNPVTVFIKDGSYTEDLTLYTNVYLVGVSRDLVTINGAHTAPASGVIAFENINFTTGTTVISGGSGANTMTFNCCYFNCVSIFNMSAATTANFYSCFDFSSANKISNTGNVILSIYSSSLGTGATGCTMGTTTTIYNSIIGCPITTGSGASQFNYVSFTGNVDFTVGTITANNCIYAGTVTGGVTINMFCCSLNSTAAMTAATVNAQKCYIGAITHTTSGTATYKDCYFYGNITANAGTTVVLDACTIDSGSTASGAGTISYAGNYLGRLTVLGALSTAPVDSTAGTSAFGSIAVSTALQNTTGYDILVNVSVSVSSSITATIVLGVGPTSTPTTDTVVPSFTVAAATVYSFSAVVPNNYYVLVDTTGTISVGSITTQTCPI